MKFLERHGVTGDEVVGCHCGRCGHPDEVDQWMKAAHARQKAHFKQMEKESARQWRRIQLLRFRNRLFGWLLFPSQSK